MSGEGDVLKGAEEQYEGTWDFCDCLDGGHEDREKPGYCLCTRPIKRLVQAENWGLTQPP